jgi:predicted dehydrogenase
VAEAPLSKPLQVGVFGTGALGRHHARILTNLPGVELQGIFDTRAEIAQAVAAEHGCRVAGSFAELADRIDAAVLAVPTVAHAELGVALLRRGIHLLVEKPIAATLAEADDLLAAAHDKVLAVGHVEFYNPAVATLLRRCHEDRLSPGFVEIQRLAVATPRSLDVDVVLDLMIHDLQILHALDPSPVEEVRATGIHVLSERVDIANARIALASGCVATITASRVSAEKVRKLRVFLPQRYFSVDYQEQEIKGYRLEEVEGRRRIVPGDLQVERAEPLRRELEAFVAACRGDEVLYVDGVQGRRALETALAVGTAIATPG